MSTHRWLRHLTLGSFLGLIAAITWVAFSGSYVDAQSTGNNSRPIATFSGHSETLIRFYQQEDVERIRNLLAFIEILSVSSQFPTVPDLSIQLSGWGQIDAIDTLNTSQVTGDLSLAMIAYRDPKMRFQAFLGRQYLYQNNKVLHFDGARVEARTPFGLGARVFAGWIVRPQFAPSIGYFMTGARVSHRVGHRSEVGITFLEMLEDGRPAHELLGIDVMVLPLNWLEISGSASADLHLLQLRQAGGRIDLTPWRWIRLTVGYEYSMPSAFISKNSIFSVFSTNSFHEAYAQLWFYLLRRRLSFGIDARLIHLPDEPSEQDLQTNPNATAVSFPTGDQIRLYARYQYSRRPSGWVGVTLERLRDQNDGHYGIRLFWQQQWSDFLLAADAQYYNYNREIRGFPHSFYTSLSGRWNFAPGWALTGSLQFTLNPFVQQSWLGLLKLSYQFYAEIPARPSVTKAATVKRGGKKP